LPESRGRCARFSGVGRSTCRVAFLRDAQEAHRGLLATHPLIGRRVEGEKRELVVSRGVTGHVVLYVFDPVSDVVLVLRARHQRECGFND
jgi:plasmid stabilization system protein ParE